VSSGFITSALLPFIPGQTSGLIAGIGMTIFFILVYAVMKWTGHTENAADKGINRGKLRTGFAQEFSEELTGNQKIENNRIQDKSNEMKCNDTNRKED
jgi:hypothetical protein